MTLRRHARTAALAAGAGVLLTSTTFVGGPASSQAPAGDCAPTFPVADLLADDDVHGLTVSTGTTPEAFTGDVLGVLDDGIAPDIDMVIVRLQSEAIDRVGGIWQGMSGSPVYAADGRLIGAVSYGLSTTSPVAGVTPYENMQDYLPATPPPRPLDRALARTVAEAAGVSTEQAAQGFRQLPMALGVSGVRAGLLGKRTKAHPWVPRSSYVAGRAGAAAAGPDTIVAGGNLAASLSYGDITLAGVGTATSVCDGRVVAFGHPLAYLGETTEVMHPADAIYVQEGLLAPFKVANIGDPAGTITGDHLTGLTGEIGPLPTTTPVSSSTTYGDRHRSGTSHAAVGSPDVLATTAYYQFAANHDRVLDASATGQELMTWTVTGTDEQGAPFSLSFPNRYHSSWDLTGEIGYYVGDAVYEIASIPGVSIDSITSDAADVSPRQVPDRIISIQRRQGGAWVELKRRTISRVAAGSTLRLRVTVSGAEGERTIPLQFDVPRKASGQLAQLAVSGGGSMWSRPDLSSIAKARSSLRKIVRNDEIQAQFGRVRGDSFYYFDEEFARGERVRRARFNQTLEIGPLDSVIGGSVNVRVLIR